MAQAPQTAPPSTKQVAKLLAAFQDREVDPQYLRLVPIRSFPGLLVVGEQVTTHSDDLQGVVLWDEHDLKLGEADEMVAEAMARAGWGRADEQRRQDLAMDWVRDVGLQFAGSVQNENLAVFGKKGRPSFHPPTARSLPDGGVEVSLWYRAVERGKSSTRDFCSTRVSFGPGGQITGHHPGACFSVPNQEWRKAL